MSVLKKLPPFQNVGASLTAVLPAMPTVMGWTIEQIFFKLGGGNTIANMTGIRVWLGGKKIVEITGSHLDAINKYFKLTGNAAYLPIWFANPKAKGLADYLLGALDTSRGYSGMSIEIDLGAGVAPTLEAYARISAPIPKQADFRDTFRTLIKSAHAPGSAAEHSLAVPLGTSAGAFIRALHFFHAQITQVQVTKDSFYLIEQGLNAVMQFDQNQLARTTQAGLLSADFVLEDTDALAVPTLRQPGNVAGFDVKVTTAAADAITAYSDLLRTFEAV